MSLTRLLLSLCIVYLISSCTVGRIVWYLKPSLDDHNNGIFVCDTIRGCGEQPIPTTSNATENTGFYQPSWVAQLQDLPTAPKWLAPELLLEGESVDDFLKRKETTAFLVIQNDTLLYEHYFNEGAADKAIIVFSITKAFTATLTAIAIEEGHLRLDQPVADFLPAFAQKNRGDLQIQHLMNMVSGLRWGDFDDLWQLGHLYYTGNQEHFVAQSAQYKHPAGTHFSYQSLATQILGVCLEKAIEQPLAQYMFDKIWQPVGMKYNAYWTLDNKKRRHARTFGGLALTATDMARFGQLLMHRGNWKGQQIIPIWFIEQLEGRDLNHWFGYVNSYWRNGYVEPNYAAQQYYYAAGYKGQYIYVDPQSKIVIVRTGKDDDQSWSLNLGRLTAWLSKGQNDLTNPKLDYSAEFAGTYYNEKGDTMSIAALPKEPNKVQQWSWTHNLPIFKEIKNLSVLHTFDGMSIGFRQKNEQTRLYYDIQNEKVIGLYHNSWPQTSLNYYKKVR
jgi:CubicO group peptidase (beta-lactamase class C family)